MSEELNLVILDGLNIDECTPNENAIKRIDKHLEKCFPETWFFHPMAITEMAVELLVTYNTKIRGKQT